MATPKTTSIQAVAVIAHLRDAGKSLTAKEVADRTGYGNGVMPILRTESSKDRALIVKDGANYSFAKTKAAVQAHDSMLGYFKISLEKALTPKLSEKSLSAVSKAPKKAKVAPKAKAPKIKAPVKSKAPAAAPKAKKPVLPASKATTTTTSRRGAAEHQASLPLSFDPVSHEDILSVLSAKPLTVGQIQEALGRQVNLDDLNAALSSLEERNRVVVKMLGRVGVYSRADAAPLSPAPSAHSVTQVSASNEDVDNAVLAVLTHTPMTPKAVGDLLPHLAKTDVSRSLSRLNGQGTISVTREVKPVGYMLPGVATQESTEASAVVPVSLIPHFESIKDCANQINNSLELIEAAQQNEAFPDFMTQLGEAVSAIKESSARLQELLSAQK